MPGQHRQQLPGGGELRLQVGLELALQLARGLVEHATARRLLAQRQHDAGKRPVERAQGGGQALGGGLVVDGAVEHGEIEALRGQLRLARAQFLEGARIAGRGNHRAAGGERGFDYAAADRLGRVENQHRSLHRPALGTFIPVGGIIPPGRTLPGIDARRDKAREIAAARRKERVRIGDMGRLRGTR